MTNLLTSPPPSRSRSWAAPAAAAALAVLSAFLVFGTVKPAAPTLPAPGRTAAVATASPSLTTELLETPHAPPTAVPAGTPLHAVERALAEPDPTRRTFLVREALRNWAASDPNAAADWAWAHQADIEQGHAFSAIFDGARQNPDSATRLARRLAAEHPEEAHAFGRHLVHSLSTSGHFAPAAAYAADSPADHRTDLLTGAYHAWGSREPEQALRSAIAIDDPLRQNAAFHATIDGWALTNPQSLTAAAYDFPAGPDRTFALVTGLRRWIEKDPAAAEAWIKTHPLTPEESARALEE